MQTWKLYVINYMLPVLAYNIFGKLEDRGDIVKFFPKRVWHVPGKFPIWNACV